MPKIKELSQEIVSKTAAGEVVERPASAIKELLDNSIDAGADTIKIEIQESGLKKILFIDNGEGMDREDVIECFKPHTTSKIKNIDDLTGIKTLGFRGEALNSISAISELCIKSRLKDTQQGTEVIIKGGNVESLNTVGMPQGTIIEINNLFYNVPVRKKFLKSSTTEFRHILSVIINTAISQPQIAIKLKHNQKTILDLPKNQTTEERIEDVLGENVYSNLIPLENSHTYYKLSGFISTPQLSAETLNNQFLFVNKRCVKNKLISSLIKDTYKSLLEPRAQPPFILFLELPHDSVDVNIHPRKEEVAFCDEKSLGDFIKEAVLKTLNEANLTYETDFFGNSLNYKEADPYLFNKLKESTNIWQPYNKDEVQDVIQIHNLYLITQTKKGLMLIDQHAAHERILYEQFLESYQKDINSSQTLENPILLELSLSEAYLLKDAFEVLSKIGFEIEEFGKNIFKINKAPKLLQEQKLDEIVKEIITDLSEGKDPKDINKKSLKTISYLACRSAVKAGEYLNPEERKALLKKLAETKTNYTCPHGRPVKVEIPLNQVAKLFKRL